MIAARAKAMMEGRLAPSVADVAALARPALKHRMALTFAAKAEGDSVDRVIETLLGRTLDVAAAA
jgi:MoxR-like ATPase